MANILVIAPHALDEVLGCGGTIAAHADKGDTVEVLVLFGDGTGMDAKRRVNAPLAAQVLKTTAPRFAGFPENRSDTLPLTDLIGTVEKAITELRPSVLFLPHGGNLNIDHQTAYKAAVTAARPAPGQMVKTIYCYEILSSTDWVPTVGAMPFMPTRFVDISTTLDRKMSALEIYGAEMRPAPHSRSVEGVAASAHSRGYSVGLPAAESFVVARDIVDSI